MSLSQVKTWSAGDVLTAADLNAEFANIYNNGASLVQPWSGTFDLDGNTLILDGDADTSIDAAVDDTIDITIAGADDFRWTANTFTALSGSSIQVVAGNIGIAAGNLTVTDGATSLSDADARTATVATPLTISAETSGTPAAGIGTGILFRAESADEAPSNFGQIEFAASDVTAASEDTYFQVLLRVAGAALTAVYRFVSTTAFKAIFTHANLADRTYTLPDITGEVLTDNSTATLSNKNVAVAPASPIANRLYADSLVKGFVVWQVDGTIDTDLNVSSITDTNPGEWTINWATSFATANYVMTFGAQADDAGVLAVASGSNPTAAACPVVYCDTASSHADPTGGSRNRLYAQAVGLQ